MRNFKLMTISLLAGCAALAGPAMAQKAQCELDRPVVFAGLDWDSNAFHTAVAQYIIKHGYGCEVDKIPGSTIPLLNGMARGDIDVTMEIWKDNVTEAWNEAEKRGQVVDLGINFPDAVQAWWVPKYLVEGADAPAPDLKSVRDLARYKNLFRDPEEPSKGRFYNCIAGWGCEVVNTKKFEAYGLDAHFTNFRPGTGGALAAAIESNIKRKRPIVFYYWGPTWVLGKVGDEVVQLEEPAYDKAIWEAMGAQEHPTEVTAYPLVKVTVGANKKFADSAPRLVAFLKKYETTNAMVSQALAYMQDTDGSADNAAIHFLQENEALWTEWVPADVADRVKSALSQS